MAYNTVSIQKDVDGKPIPQYYNILQDVYEVLQGRNGANRIEIYGPDGDPVSVVSNKLAVRASEIEAILSVIAAKDFATEAKQTALEALVGTLTDTAVNDPTASGTIIALLKGLITQMQGDGAS